MDWKKMTAALLAATTITLIAYDIFAEVEGSNPSTILDFGAGFLYGHLFCSQKENLPSP